MPPDVDENIRYDISLVVQDLAENPEAVVSLFNNIFDWQAGKTPSLKTFWQLGLRGSSTLLYRGARLWLKGGDDPFRTLFQNGLAEELAKIQPEKLQKILAIAVDHPLIMEQESYKNIVKDLNDPAFVAACLTKPDKLLDVYDKWVDYQSTDKDFVSIDSSIVNKRYNEFVVSLVNLAVEPEVKGALRPLTTPQLMNHIHETPALIQHSNSKKLFANMARKQPEEFQKLVGTILSQDKELRDKVINAVLGYTNLPVNEAGDKELERLTQKNWEEMVHSLVELASKEEVREDLKKVATEQLVDDIYNLDALKNQQFSRKLVADLAKDNPEDFQDLVEEILASPYKETILPATTKLLAYLSSTDEKTPENETIRADMILEFSKIAAEPKIAEKIAPLLSGSLVSNLLEMEGAERYGDYRDLFHKVANTLSTKPQMLNLLLKTYNDASVKAVSEKALEGAPEIIEDNKQEIIKEKGKSYFESLKRMANSISQRIRGKKSSKVEPEGVELVELSSKANTTKSTNIVDVIRKASEVMDDESIQNLLLDPQLKTLIGDFIKNKPDNPNVVALNKLGIKEDKLVDFAKRLGSKEGLNALADYMEEKITISKLVSKTKNRTFVIKNLYTIIPIYYKSLTPEAKSQAKEESNKLHAVFTKVKNAGNWVRHIAKKQDSVQKQR